MKILQVIDSLEVGGAQKLLQEFMREISTREHEVEVIVLSRPKVDPPIYKTLQDLDIRVEWLPFKNLVDIQALIRFRRRIKALNPDIVHTQLNYANILGVLAAGQAGFPVVASLHNASVHLYNYRPYRTWLETWALSRWARRIIACGFTVARVQQHRFPRKELVVIPNPVPAQPDVPKSEIGKIRGQYLPQKDGYLLVSVGRLIPEKGYFDLIEAMRVIRSKFEKHVKLLIVGKGFLREKLQKQVDEMSMSDHIYLLGERNDVPLLLAASDIYISASHYEGQSLAVLEAMASELPVVATDVGDNSRVIKDGYGIVLPVGKPEMMAREIIRLLEDKQERERIGRNAKRHICEDYSVKKWTDHLVALYTEVLHG